MVEPFGLDRVADHERELRVIKRMIMDLEERFRKSPGTDDGQAQARLHQDVEALKQIVDQLSSREGVTLHRLETLKERIDEFTALGREVEELKRRAESLAGPSGSLPAEVVAAFTDGLREARQQLEVLRANQAAQAKRLDALKEENAKLRSEHRQLEAQAHAALEALQERGARLEERLVSAQPSPPPPPPSPRRVAARRSNLDSLRERAARVAEISDPSEAADS